MLCAKGTPNWYFLYDYCFLWICETKHNRIEVHKADRGFQAFQSFPSMSKGLVCKSLSLFLVLMFVFIYLVKVTSQLIIETSGPSHRN